MACDDYVLPSSVEEALASLASLRGQGRLIAGGTDLFLQLQRGERNVRCLVDITRIPGLSDIRVEDSWLVVGAATTFTQITDSSLVQERAPLLAQAAAQVGSTQIRNVGTLAGNVVNAQPAADGSIALLSLDAEAEIANLTGRQWVSVASLYVSPGVSRLDATVEMITAFRFRAQGRRESSAFERAARRKALTLPLINVGVRLLLDRSGSHVRQVSIAIGPVAPVPFRAREAEALLRGRAVSEDTISEAVEVAANESRPRSSLLRAGKEYRRELIAVLVRRALVRAIEGARG
jgi:carbon-monoxide dehydrogenase medium subunit